MTFPGHLRKEDYPEAYAQEKDPRYSRFMAYISLFATGMLGLVVSNSLLTFFVFWEIMGFCSYALISFWYEKPTAKRAGFKAFMTTRVGDTIMFVGMILLYIWSVPSTLVFRDILSLENLHQLSEHMVTVPLLGITAPAIAIVAVLIFFGTIGKSAQFPLHVWLPDAMEGPTPVSAMIHAATMVSAGVFLVVRMYPLFMVAGEVSPGTLTFVATVGSFTALFASLIGLTQWDIKRVLAYSTIAQLGFMIAALGVGAYMAGLFHLITHAFFKALLFLGSGSVIHGVEHGFHHAHAHAGHGHDEALAEAVGGEHGGEEDAHGHMHGPGIISRPDGDLDPNDPAGHAQHGRPAQAHAHYRLDVCHRRPGPGRLPLPDRRLLVKGRDSDQFLVWRPHGRLLGGGLLCLPDRLLRGAPDFLDLPGPAAQRRRCQCAGKRQAHDGAADPDHAVCGGLGLVWHSGQLPGVWRHRPQLAGAHPGALCRIPAKCTWCIRSLPGWCSALRWSWRWAAWPPAGLSIGASTKARSTRCAAGWGLSGG